MKMESLAHASIDQLALVQLRLEPCTVPANHRYIMEASPTERFVYISQGSVRFSLANSSVNAQALDMVYLPRNTAYHSLWLENAAFVVVDILLQDSDGFDIQFGDLPCVLFHDTHQIYANLLEELGEKAYANGPFDWLERLSLCFKLLCQMARDTNQQELDEQNRLIQKALVYIDSNYAEDFPVDTLANICLLSPARFRRLFKSCKGCSPIEYRNRLRIRKAAELLRTGQYTVNEVADLVGIHDVKYFGKIFTYHMGISPGKLKKGI